MYRTLAIGFLSPTTGFPLSAAGDSGLRQASLVGEALSHSLSTAEGGLLTGALKVLLESALKIVVAFDGVDSSSIVGWILCILLSICLIARSRRDPGKPQNREQRPDFVLFGPHVVAHLFVTGISTLAISELVNGATPLDAGLSDARQPASNELIRVRAENRQLRDLVAELSMEKATLKSALERKE